ncbi:MAG: hypothetical protein SOW08_08435 [Lachnospiraceae bacterium]|nr:hypothetical protein [Lachnospiraceae bacterium]
MRLKSVLLKQSCNRAYRKSGFRSLNSIRAASRYLFHGFFRNPVVILTLIMGFVLSYLLSIRVMEAAEYFGSSMQVVEPFIWTFGDPTAIMLTSVLLIFMFSDLPGLTAASPFYLMRITKLHWLLGQFLYIAIASGIYTGYIVLCTCLLCARYSYIGNIWSRTAMYLAYSDTGKEINVPSTVKMMESITPYECMMWIAVLLLCYCLSLAFLMMTASLFFGGKSGIFAGFVYSLYGFLLDREVLRKLLGLSETQMWKVNSLICWISPLNHATYDKHDFGHDNQPSLWQSVFVFGVILLIFMCLSFRAMKRYNFTFLGESD